MILVCLTLAFVQSEWGQNILARQVTARLSKDLQSRIKIDHVEFGFFNKMNLKGVLIEDQKKDTLLAAGIVQVRITDWFFLKDKAVLNYVGLENAVINFNRTDSVWNYHFLAAYFSTPTKSTKKKSGLELNLKTVVMRNVVFNQKDAWRGENMFIKVGSLDLDANDLSISKKVIDINSLDLVKPYFQIYSYTGNRPPSEKQKVKQQTAAQQWNPDNWTILLDGLSLKEGTFRMDVDSLHPSVAYFDGQHMQWSAINGNIKNFKLLGDTLRAKIDLATTERSGFTVEQLKTDYRFHPQLMEFANLTLKTDKSVLGNYFAMKFGKLSDMSDFIHAVTMDANFKGASIASDDIAYFAPTIKDWNRQAKITGHVKGTVDAIAGNNVQIQAGKNSSFNGDFSLVGLPDINSTYINIRSEDLRTNYNDLVSFIPSLKGITTPNLKKLNNIRFAGVFRGLTNDFYTNGTLNTSLGTIAAELNMKLPNKGEPVYSGHLNTGNFQLGQFINNNQLGTLAFNGDINGTSFNWNKLNLNINGTVRKFYFGGYNYQNITAKGNLKNKTFNGNIIIKDPNADLKLTGLINMGGKTPVFNVDAAINRLNLHALNLSKEDVALSGDFKLNFSGNNLSTFFGNANISNAVFYNNGKELSLNNLSISSTYTNGIRTLTAQSDELNGTITGKFDLASLPDAVTLFLNRYYPSYIKPPHKQVKNQSFTFDITTGVVEDYVKLIDKRLSGFNNSHISGSLDIATNSLVLNADVPKFGFDRYDFSDVVVKGDGNFERLVLDGQVNNALISDSLSFPETNFHIQAKNDVSDILINTTANKTINQANVSAQVRTFSNGVSISFNPSSFVLNGKTWNIDEGGELDFRTNTVVHGQLLLREANQAIRISTQPSSIGDWSDIHVALENLNIGDFTPFFVKGYRIEGLLNGDIVIEDPQNRLNIFADNIRTDQLRVDNDSIGQMQAALSYNNITGMLTAKGSNFDPEHVVNVDLAMDLKDSAKTFRDRITIGAINYPVKILERFLGTLFSNMQGYITGNLNILGEGSDMQYVGKARLKDAGMKVNFTQVFYKIDDTEIELAEDEIKLGVIKLRDSKNRTATVRGTIHHKNFKNMVYDIAADVDSRPMELLNTSYRDNQTFYGKAYGTGSFVLLGPEYDMFMQIDAKASEIDSSFITLPPSKTRESGSANFMVERKYGVEMSGEVLRGSATNITYEVNLAANKMVGIDVILDELTGDIIKGRGAGNLKIRAGTSEPLSIRGRYDIQEGSYLFTFQSFFKKPFTLRKGSNNYIEWTGDPYKAQINFDAEYEANKVSFAPLASSLVSSASPNLSRARTDVTVIANLSGDLFRPTFNFQLEFPQNFYTSVDQTTAFAIQQALQQIQRNPNELNKQVTYLIVFNSFAPYEGLQNSSYNPLSEFAYSTISGLFFGEVNKRLNQLLSKILNNNDLTVNFSGSLYNSSLINQAAKGFNINQSNLNLSIGKSLFNERVILSLGGSFDVPLDQTSIQQRIQLFPDVTVEFLINKTGTIRATVFYRQTPDLISGTTPGISRGTQRAGANIAYQKDLTSLSELLFGRRKGRLKAQKEREDSLRTLDSTGKTNL